MSKKNKKVKVSNYSSDSDEMKRMIKVLLSVVIVLVAVYFVFAIYNGEISFGGKKERKKDEIQNVEILAGTTFNRSDVEYYVLFYDFEANDSINYANIYDLNESYGESKVYLVDLNKKFNKDYIVEDAKEINISSIDSLKVVNGTLVKVKDGKGVSYVVGTSAIKKLLLDVE